MNPYGSTAGAGSGEFHVYRHARAREMQRMQTLDEQEREELLQSQYEQQLQQYKKEEQGRTEKRRRKRKRQKEAKLRKKNLTLAGVLSGELEDDKVEGDNDEFTYDPCNEQEDADERDKQEKTSNSSDVSKATPKLPFTNDGSFLEQMKKRLAAEQEGKQEEGEYDNDEEESRPKKKQET